MAQERWLMRICECFAAGKPVFSFEFFPPKTDEGVRNLFATLEELAPLKPSFVSVTYGAGGSTRDLTVGLTSRIKREIGLEAMAHLTCVGHSAAELTGVLESLRDVGIENVLALRGDPPKGQERFEKHPEGFAYASSTRAFQSSAWAAPATRRGTSSAARRRWVSGTRKPRWRPGSSS
jgi:methylenetetrahydrofolate reductase (NADPH)